MNYCVTGDKVVIKNCVQLSKTKSYYVKNIVKPFGRDDHYNEVRRAMELEREELERVRREEEERKAEEERLQN